MALASWFAFPRLISFRHRGRTNYRLSSDEFIFFFFLLVLRKTSQQLEYAADVLFFRYFVCETRNLFKHCLLLRKRSEASRWRRCFEHSVFLTVSINQSCNSRRVQSIPSLLPSLRSHPSSPLLHSDTSVHCMHFSFFVFRLVLLFLY